MMNPARPLPNPAPESLPFWESCRKHELRLQRCGRCNAYWFPPSAFCPECWSTDWEWKRVSGLGKLYSFVVYHRAYHPAFATELPYLVGVIALDEGPRLTSNLVGCEPGDVHCGMAVAVCFDDVTPTITLPKFRPCPASSERVGTDSAKEDGDTNA
jgi:uncharacterized OB-fold protein